MELTRDYIMTQFLPALAGIDKMVDKFKENAIESAIRKLKLPYWIDDKNPSWFKHNARSGKDGILILLTDNTHDKWLHEPLLMLCLKYDINGAAYMKAFDKIEADTQSFELKLLTENLAIQRVLKEQPRLDKKLERVNKKVEKALAYVKKKFGSAYPYDAYEISDDDMYEEDENGNMIPYDWAPIEFNEEVGEYSMNGISHVLWDSRVEYIIGDREMVVEHLMSDYDANS